MTRPAESLSVDVEWLHRFINAVPFGEHAPLEDIDRAHLILRDLALAAKGMEEELAIAKSAIKAMAEDGWLYHGVEGMSESQDLCYEAYLTLGLKELPDGQLRSRKYVDAMCKAATAHAKALRHELKRQVNLPSVLSLVGMLIAELQSLNPKNEEGK